MWTLGTIRICNLIIEAKGIFFFQAMVGCGRRCLDSVFFKDLSVLEMNCGKLGDHMGEFSRRKITCKRAVVFFFKKREQKKMQSAPNLGDTQ